MTTTGGLFDLQVNGFAGVDFNDCHLSVSDFERALGAMLATGVTGCLPTLITASRSDLLARFAALDHAVTQSRLGPLMVPGYHLEGPFLNPAPGFCGCHPAGVMIAPDIALVDEISARLARPILLITVAPELPGSMAFIAAARARGIVVAMGHSDARQPVVQAATCAGMSLATHLGNGVAHLQHKFDNPIVAQLADDSLTACFIADGIHVPPHVLKMMLRAKGLARSILVTDAVSAAAAPPGIYPFAGMVVERTADGTVRERGAPHLAGSSLTLDAAVRNVAGWGLCSFAEAVAMAGARPRAILHPALTHHRLMLDPGRVVWSVDHHVIEAGMAGETLFTASTIEGDET